MMVRGWFIDRLSTAIDLRFVDVGQHKQTWVMVKIANDGRQNNG